MTIDEVANHFEISHGSAYDIIHNNLMPGKYPEENIQYSNHGESLKSRIRHLYGEDIALHIRRLQRKSEIKN